MRLGHEGPGPSGSRHCSKRHHEGDHQAATGDCHHLRQPALPRHARQPRVPRHALRLGQETQCGLPPGVSHTGDNERQHGQGGYHERVRNVPALDKHTHLHYQADGERPRLPNEHCDYRTCEAHPNEPGILVQPHEGSAVRAAGRIQNAATALAAEQLPLNGPDEAHVPGAREQFTTQCGVERIPDEHDETEYARR